MDINILLDKAKKMCGVTTDKDLSTRLGVTPSAVTNYRKGRALPDAVTCATLAGLTGEPLAKVLGVVGEARAISREEKAVWRKLAATAAMVLCVIGFAGNALAVGVSGWAHGAMPIMLNALRYWWRIALLLVGQHRKPQGPYIEARL